jgi:hypothetical protein
MSPDGTPKRRRTTRTKPTIIVGESIPVAEVPVAEPLGISSQQSETSQ